MEQLIKRFGQTFSVLRSGSQIGQISGLYDPDKDMLSFLPDADIKVGDILKGQLGKQLFITKVSVLFSGSNPHHTEAKCQDKNEIRDHAATTTFNINTVSNSVVGNYNTTTIYGSLDSMKEEVAAKGGADTAELNEIISLLERIAANNEPIKKGILSKFSAVMERNSWFTGSVTSFFLSLLLH